MFVEFAIGPGFQNCVCCGTCVSSVLWLSWSVSKYSSVSLHKFSFHGLQELHQKHFVLHISVCPGISSHFPSLTKPVRTQWCVIFLSFWRFCKWPFCVNIKVNLLRSGITVRITLTLINVSTKCLYWEFLWVCLLLYL